MIQSTSNEHIKQVAKLKQKKYREMKQEFLAEGEHLTFEASKQGLVKEIFCLEPNDISFYDGKTTQVSANVLEKLTFSKTPQAMVALCQMPCIDFDVSKMKRVFLLDGLQDPGNIGTIIRTSLAMGFDGIMLSKDCVDLYNDKLLRACQGANFYLPIWQGDLQRAIQTLKQHQFVVYATALRNARPIQQFSNEAQMAFVLGNEGNGVKEETIAKCDSTIYIPIKTAESLNVAVCAGMIAFNFQNV